MASPNVYVPGGSLGARLATRGPLFHSGSIWYVGPGGTDAASPAGRQRNAPLATLGQAFTNAAAGDTIQVLAGTTIALSGNLNMNKAGLHVYGEGDETTRPIVTSTGGFVSLTLGAAGMWLEGFTFPVPTGAGGSHVTVGAASCAIVNCLFECNANTANRAVQLSTGSSNTSLVGVTFRSVAASTLTRPAIALESTAAISDIMLDTVIIDGGSFGWTDYAVKFTTAVTRLVGIDVDFLNDSDFQAATASQYKFHRRLGTGSQRMEFIA